MIKTYPEMNSKIKELLRAGEDPINFYAAQRIDELETLNAELVKKLKEIQK